MISFVSSGQVTVINTSKSGLTGEATPNPCVQSYVRRYVIIPYIFHHGYKFCPHLLHSEFLWSKNLIDTNFHGCAGKELQVVQFRNSTIYKSNKRFWPIMIACGLYVCMYIPAIAKSPATAHGSTVGVGELAPAWRSQAVNKEPGSTGASVSSEGTSWSHTGFSIAKQQVRQSFTSMAYQPACQRQEEGVYNSNKLSQMVK